MSLTDNTYFVRDRKLPIKTGGLDDTGAAITRYEPEILEHILGYTLAKLVLAYSAGSPQRIKDIVDGKEYTQGAFTVNWNGLKNTEKVSILTDYTYIQYVRDHAADFQSVGATMAVVENGVVISPTILIQRATMSMRELVGYEGQSIYKPSLRNFLKAHETDYPDLIFNDVRAMNTLGI